jgi:hypothetical protein
MNIGVYVKGDHLYFSFLLAGLERLHHQGFCSLKYIYPWDNVFRSNGSSIILSMNLLGEGNCSKNICFDFSDSNDSVSDEALEYHDLYYKRSYNARQYAFKPLLLQNKIKPFGPVFPCKYSPFSRAMRNLTAGSLLYKNEPFNFKSMIGQFYNYQNLPHLADYENPVPSASKAYVLFQTRAWNPGNYENWREINDSRLQVIRALKAHFKDRFIGGFVPDTFSRRHYSDSLTVFPSSRRAYVNLMKESLICVYTRGLFDSPAFKLGEYLAAGRCIVAEPLINQLPEPLQEDLHYLPFATAEQCVAQCIQLDQDRSLANRMMNNNAAYYHDHVEPSRQLRRAIEMAFTKS